jgi:hypothetical protein
MNHLFRLGFAATTTFLFLIILSASQTVSAQLIISEFRVRGPNGANDEFIELYNNSGADHTVVGGGTGYAVAASNGVARCVVPNGTVIPNRGHYLCVNSVGYSLASHPAGNGTTATGDVTYTTDIPDNAGIAIFNTSVAANFTLANRLDAVGSTSEANTLYKEGTGYPALTPFSIDYSFYRDNCGKSGSITIFGVCPISTPKDTNNNAADFIFVDTNGTSAGAGQRLGAPGPENLSGPIQRNPSFAFNVLDPCVGSGTPPNRVRDFTSDPANNSTFGTLDIRKTVTNNTGDSVTRLRWRIIDLTTFPAPSGIADLRPRTSTAVVVTVDRAPCGSGTSNVTVQGTTLEQPPSQPNGSGFNGSLSSGTVTLATPLANGASLDVRFLLGIQQTGSFKFYINIEVLQGGGMGAAVSPGEPVAAKNQQWTDWKAATYGITGERTVSSLAPAPTNPGWFIVVPPNASRDNNSHRKTSLAVSPANEESAAEPSTVRVRGTSARIEASPPVVNDTTPAASVEAPAPAKSSMALPLALNPAVLKQGVTGSSTGIDVPATNASSPKAVSAAKERRKSRRSNMRNNRKTTRRR